MSVPSSSAAAAQAVAPPAVRPTRARDIAVAYTILLAIITYIDRVCISMAAPSMQRDLGLSPIQMGWAFSAFGGSSALCEVPGGWLDHGGGPRPVPTRRARGGEFSPAAAGRATGHPAGARSPRVGRPTMGAEEARGEVSGEARPCEAQDSRAISRAFWRWGRGMLGKRWCSTW